MKLQKNMNWTLKVETAQMSPVGVIVGPRQADRFMFSWEEQLPTTQD